MNRSLSLSVELEAAGVSASLRLARELWILPKVPYVRRLGEGARVGCCWLGVLGGLEQSRVNQIAFISIHMRDRLLRNVRKINIVTELPCKVTYRTKLWAFCSVKQVSISHERSLTSSRIGTER